MKPDSVYIELWSSFELDSFAFIDVGEKTGKAAQILNDLTGNTGDMVQPAIAALSGIEEHFPDFAPPSSEAVGQLRSSSTDSGLGDTSSVGGPVPSFDEAGTPAPTEFASLELPDGDDAIPGWPAWHGGPGLGHILPLDLSDLAARGGNPGPPDKPGGPGGDDGTGEPSTNLTATYTSGQFDTLTYDFFNITVEFYGSLWTTELHEAFVASADYLSSIIVEGLPQDTYLGSFYADQQVEFTADDLVIEAHLTDIDGSGGILGQAGPTYARSSDGSTIDGLPVAGIMEFDVADATDLLGSGLWDDTVFHEMMHVLGFGTLWDFENWNLVGDQLLLIDDNGTRRPVDDVTGYAYLGDANTHYDGGDFLVVESGGGSGTARGHWSESVHANEIMTGYINSSNYLADFTVAALADLGYSLASSDYADLADPLSAGIDLTSVNSVDWLV